MYKKNIYADQHRIPAPPREKGIRFEEQLRIMSETGIHDLPIDAENFDDLPGQPSKNMEADPQRQTFIDPFDRAEMFANDLEKVRVAAQAAQAADGSGQPEAEGAEGTPAPEE